ncbi:hypothetical protein Golob_005989 [Gossypium lobatum]|uniref:Uncharacterized protein n=1 Tax=Gossypium lobatum TaxID=34289 RepID=A0A7J8MV19_9ROSI|nr:hypothetical protein [Gossypium lobatum]
MTKGIDKQALSANVDAAQRVLNTTMGELTEKDDALDAMDFYRYLCGQVSIEFKMKITLKRLHNSTGRTWSYTDATLGSIDITRTFIGRTHSSKQGSFGHGLLSIPWLDQPIFSEFYCYLEDF